MLLCAYGSLPDSTAGPKKSWDPWDRVGSGSRSVPRHSNSLLQGAAGWGRRCARQARGKLAEMKGALLLPPLRAAAVDAGSFHARGLPEQCRAKPGSPARPRQPHNDRPASRSVEVLGWRACSQLSQLLASSMCQ